MGKVERTEQPPPYDHGYHIKLELLPFKKTGYFYFNESSLEIMNNAFYFILKSLFILKVACKFRFGKSLFLKKYVSLHSFLYLPYIYKNPVNLSLLEIITLIFAMYFLTI